MGGKLGLPQAENVQAAPLQIVLNRTIWYTPAIVLSEAGKSTDKIPLISMDQASGLKRRTRFMPFAQFLTQDVMIL
jgi:hypothetical protein